MSAVAPVQAVRENRVARDSDPLVMTRLFDDDIGAVCWQRPADAAITRLCGSLPHGTVNVRSSGTPAALMSSLDFLPDVPGRAALAEDIFQVSDMFATLLDEPELGMRLTQVNSPMCPRWHTDRVMVRLIVSYGARGTQWHHQDSDAQATLEQASDQDVLLLKGDLWSTDGTPGVRHRSPPGTQSRLLLTLDML